MKAIDVYTWYHIPPNLADHQLTVAAVGSYISLVTGKGNQKEIIAACLLHDMGNIIKFNFERPMPDLGDNIPYWKGIREQFILEYGDDPHKATLAIALDHGVPDRIIDMIEGIGYPESIETLKRGDDSQLVAAYSDLRVAPWGVVSLEERLQDLMERYGPERINDQNNNAFREMERVIFRESGHVPEDIPPEEIRLRKKLLRDFEV